MTRIFNREAERWVSIYRPQDNYGRFALFQGAVRTRTLRRRRLAMELLAVRPGMTLLDVGCGHGAYAQFIVDAGADWLGVDVALRILKLGRKTDRETPEAGAVYVNAAASRLPFGAERFDAMLCIGVLNYYSLMDVRSILNEIRRVLRPGGVAVVSSLRLDPVTWVRSRIYPSLPLPIAVPGPLYPHQTGAISELLNGIGLRLVDVKHVKKYGVQPHYALLKLLRPAELAD